MIDKNPYATAWMSLEQAAAYLSVDVDRLKQLWRLRKISFFKIGSHYYCTATDLKKYQESLCGTK